MPEKTEIINISETAATHLPLGYKKINTLRLPPHRVDKRLTVYNRKYRFSTMQILTSKKPISKILK